MTETAPPAAAPHATEWLDAREMRAWQAFLAAGALVGRRVEQQLKEQAGLSHLQYEVLVRLAGAESGEMRMAELAEALYTSKSGLTYQVGRLEKSGLVRRRNCEIVHGVFAVLTDEGRAKLDEVAPGHVATVRAYLVDVLDEEQLERIADALEKVAGQAAEADWPV